MRKMDRVQNLSNAIFSTVAGWFTAIYIYFAPVHVLFVCIGVAWLANIFFGYWAGMRLGESFNKTKARDSIVEVLSYLSIVALLYFIGDKMGDKELILSALNLITWSFLYFYLINILRNVCTIVPKSKGIRYCKYVLSLEFFKAFPSLKKFEDEEV